MDGGGREHVWQHCTVELRLSAKLQKHVKVLQDNTVLYLCVVTPYV